MIEEMKTVENLVIEGRNAVIEAFRSGKTIDKVYVLDGCRGRTRIRTVIREAKKHDTIINFVTKERLDQLSRLRNIRELWLMQLHMNMRQ